MGKKAKKAADEMAPEEVEAATESTVEAPAADEAKPAAKKGKAKKEAVEEVTEGDGKEIFEEKSAVAQQFEEAGEPKEEITEERTYVVPLSKAYASPPKYRAKKAVIMLREFFQRHMKATELVILPEVNDEIWSKSIRTPPRKLKIRATKSIEGKVTLYLAQ